MVNKKLIIYTLCGFGVLTFLSFKTDDTIKDQESWLAPSSADKLRNPHPFVWGNRMASLSILSEGEKTYNTLCVACHGKSGQGDGAPGMTFDVKPTNFHDKSVKDETDGALFWKLSEGRGSMPSYKAVLSDEKRWQLVTYIRKLSDQDDRLLNSSGFENSLPAKDYITDPELESQYFPLPEKVSNVIRSESQLFMVDTVVTGLNKPWSMAFLPDNTVLITERSGNLLKIKNGKVQEKPVGGRIPKELRDIELHPQFLKNGLIYLSYYIEPVGPNGGYTVLMRADLDGDRLVEEKILYKAGPFKEGGFWYGSKIAFDGDGYLYFTVGQRTIDERHRWKTVQDLSNPSGKIMRFNDDGSIPADNPFFNTPAALPEIYTYGHRQPQGLVKHPQTQEIWENEHGEMGGCELNLLHSGKNYGWPEVTFSHKYNGSIISEDTVREGMEPPIHHWTPSLAPSGMDFVYGNRYSSWDGNLFIGSLVQKMLNRIVIKNNNVIREEKLLQNIGRVRDVIYAPDKFLYAMTEDTGLIVRLVPVRKK